MNKRIVLRAWLGLILLGLTGVPLHAETPGFRMSELDSWRAGLIERLDRDLENLSAGAPDEPPAFAEVRPVTRRGLLPEDRGATGESANEAEFRLPEILAILHDGGVPQELIAVALVESGFNPNALSPKGALGFWQLMPATARRYGLIVDAGRDERLDPVRSTIAAARYLKDLYAQFRDWPLTLAAYNAGEDRIKRSLDRVRTRDFWTLAALGLLPEETRRYVPSVLAAVHQTGRLSTPLGVVPNESKTPK